MLARAGNPWAVLGVLGNIDDRRKWPVEFRNVCVCAFLVCFTAALRSRTMVGVKGWGYFFHAAFAAISVLQHLPV